MYTHTLIIDVAYQNRGPPNDIMEDPTVLISGKSLENPKNRWMRKEGLPP